MAKKAIDSGTKKSKNQVPKGPMTLQLAIECQSWTNTRWTNVRWTNVRPPWEDEYEDGGEGAEYVDDLGERCILVWISIFLPSPPAKIPSSPFFYSFPSHPPPIY